MLLSYIPKNNKVAIRVEDEYITYNTLHDKIELYISDYLDSIKNGSTVLLSLDNGFEIVIILLALLQKKCAVYLFDNKATTTEINNIAIFYQIKYSIIYKTKNLNNDYKYIDNQIIIVDNKFSNILKNKTSLIFFSSGTSGTPKAFSFSDKKFIQLFLNFSMHLELKEEDSILCPLSITHQHGIMLTLPILMQGVSVHYLKDTTPYHIAEHIYKYKISILTGVPYQYMLFYENSEIKSFHLQSLRYLICGSAPLSAYLAINFEKKFSKNLMQGYGLSEIGPITLNKEILTNKKYSSIGKILPNIKYKIIDEHGKAVKRNMDGELIVKSKWMATSYIKNELETNKTFIKGWIHTNDIIKIDDEGDIYIVGRKSSFINIAGLKVSPTEIENVILGLIGVKEVVILSFNDKYKGQLLSAKIVTYIALTENDVLDHCGLYLPKYKWPTKVEFVTEIPHNNIGKVLPKKIIE
jgi:acyl-CoA synthetase (AMP-forming)/AMP-acid ligase II